MTTRPTRSSRPTCRARAARLGDLLLERGRPLAALIEYRKAAGEEGPPSPLMMARETRCLAELERQEEEAVALSEKGVTLYPGSRSCG